MVPLIAIIGDDGAMRDALSELVQVMGFASRSFDCAAAFLADFVPGRFDRLIADMRVPGWAVSSCSAGCARSARPCPR